MLQGEWVISTAGEGPIPQACLDFAELYDELYERVISMPVMAKAMQVSAFNKNVLDWLDTAKRGLYSFDW